MAKTMKWPARSICAFLILIAAQVASAGEINTKQQLYDAIYQHHKLILDISRKNYGAKYSAEDYEVKNKYEFSLFDLNGDGVQDAIVLFNNSEYCGSGGCTMEIYRGIKGRFKFISRSTITNPPIRALPEKHYGWRSLIVSSRRGSVLMRFNGNKYPLNPSLQSIATPAQLKLAKTILEN